MSEKNEWKSIDSAPKDGTPVLLFARHIYAESSTRVVGAYLLDYGWLAQSYAGQGSARLDPSHWMELPPFPGTPPASAQGDAQDERQEFEAWGLAGCEMVDDPRSMRMDIARHCAWEAWQARARIGAPAAGDALALALAALENSQPIMKHYTEPNERHQRAIEAVRAAIAPPLSGDALTAAARDVLAERQRQISAEGWTPEHDDAHTDGALAQAAACYAASSQSRDISYMAHLWPWSTAWWKPGTSRGDLLKAGALILAEIERQDRARATFEAQRKWDA